MLIDSRMGLGITIAIVFGASRMKKMRCYSDLLIPKTYSEITTLEREFQIMTDKLMNYISKEALFEHSYNISNILKGLNWWGPVSSTAYFTIDTWLRENCPGRYNIYFCRDKQIWILNIEDESDYTAFYLKWYNVDWRSNV